MYNDNLTMFEFSSTYIIYIYIYIYIYFKKSPENINYLMYTNDIKNLVKSENWTGKPCTDHQLRYGDRNQVKNEHENLPYVKGSCVFLDVTIRVQVKVSKNNNDFWGLETRCSNSKT